MNDNKLLLASLLTGFIMLCRFNAFACLLLGLAYGFIASMFERDFLGMGPTLITTLGVLCFVVFFGASIALSVVGKQLLTANPSDIQS